MESEQTTVFPKISDLVPLASLDSLEFGAWDLFPDTAYEAATQARVLDRDHLDPIKDELKNISPMNAVFYPEYVTRLHGTHVKQGATKADMVEALRADIRTFMKVRGCSRAVAIWCGSTEIFIEPSAVHQTRASFEKGLLENDPMISNSMIYAWACLLEGVPYANGAPNLSFDFPAAIELAKTTETPICGKDFKTGQNADEDDPGARL